MVKKITAPTSLFDRYHKLQERKYIEDPTYSRSIGSHVCLTCTKFDYSSQVSCGSILCCNWHKKLIIQGQHLTHSCELYQKKANLGIHKNLITHHKPHDKNKKKISNEDRTVLVNDRSKLLAEFFNGEVIQVREEYTNEP